MASGVEPAPLPQPLGRQGRREHDRGDVGVRVAAAGRLDGERLLGAARRRRAPAEYFAWALRSSRALCLRSLTTLLHQHHRAGDGEDQVERRLEHAAMTMPMTIGRDLLIDRPGAPGSRSASAAPSEAMTRCTVSTVTAAARAHAEGSALARLLPRSRRRCGET
jgi:hypothetical protein